jgi:hypothetical protein
MKKFVNQKFQKALFNTYCKVTDFLLSENYDYDCEIHSMYAYENIKLDCMLQAQENENNILVRRNFKTKNEIGKLLFF